MKDVGSFLREVAPELIELGIALFRKHRGSTARAKRDLRSRRTEIDKMWSDAEAALARKHSGR